MTQCRACKREVHTPLKGRHTSMSTSDTSIGCAASLLMVWGSFLGDWTWTFAYGTLPLGLFLSSTACSLQITTASANTSPCKATQFSSANSNLRHTPIQPFPSPHSNQTNPRKRRVWRTGHQVFLGVITILHRIATHNPSVPRPVRHEVAGNKRGSWKGEGVRGDGELSARIQVSLGRMCGRSCLDGIFVWLCVRGRVRPI